MATAIEGKTLREKFNEITVYVLEGALADTVDLLLECNLVPVLNTLSQCLIISLNLRM